MFIIIVQIVINFIVLNMEKLIINFNSMQLWKKPIIKNEKEDEEKNYYKCGTCKKIYSLILIKCFCRKVKSLNEFDKIYICSECENVRILEEVEPAEKSKKTVKNEDVNEYLNSHPLINYCKSLTSTKEINISDENNYI